VTEPHSQSRNAGETLALSAEEKEAIMAKRGESKASAASKTTIYEIILNDGKSATMLSMEGASLEEATSSAHDRFSKKRVKEVKVKV
jgi:hypothetical protein